MPIESDHASLPTPSPSILSHHRKPRASRPYLSFLQLCSVVQRSHLWSSKAPALEDCDASVRQPRLLEARYCTSATRVRHAMAPIRVIETLCPLVPDSLYAGELYVLHISCTPPRAAQRPIFVMVSLSTSQAGFRRRVIPAQTTPTLQKKNGKGRKLRVNLSPGSHYLTLAPRGILSDSQGRRSVGVCEGQLEAIKGYYIHTYCDSPLRASSSDLESVVDVDP